MCGIAGIISRDTGSIDRQRLKKMSDALAHRGPDGEGVWINRRGNAGFAHRRLAVIDLSPAGAQPMHYPSTEEPRYTIVYNGEIYNYIELKEILQAKGYIFHTQSDTEVILAAYDCYKENCLGLFDGMFAFALWDEREQQLFAARDRFGEKPFFYHCHNNALYFGSEIKALSAAGIEKRVDEQVLLYYLASGMSQSPANRQRTFYRNILSLPPAHYFYYKPADLHIQCTRYWDIDKTIETDKTIDPVERFRELFYNSVKRRLRSDVPAGTSLSGGLDSSSIVSSISGLTNPARSYKSFSVVFPGFEKDESGYIQEVITKYGIENFSISPTVHDCINDLEQVCYHQELPFDSAGIYLQFALSRLAKQHGIKVLLDGQGADEALAGYTKYFHYYLQQLIGTGAMKLFKDEKKALLSNNTDVKWSYKNYLAALLPRQAASFLRNREMQGLTRAGEIEDEFIDQYLDEELFFKPVVKNLNDILYYNTMQSGLEDLLRYADRNSMAFGRELRLPFLNHELVEFVFSLAAGFKIKEGYSKWILRETMKEKLPASVVWRRDKTGFEPPQLQWMKEPLLQERIYHSRQKLFDAGILKKSKVNIPVRPVAAYAADNMDWRYLITGALLP
ncbi:MAG: asparagine synthase (glutamine-hydrolyzing) [Chitinophagaceae bacterium]|nr:asparagine synthase (glutamine-hydrolyzing) [Chitinophagaceae bacterium]